MELGTANRKIEDIIQGNFLNLEIIKSPWLFEL